MDHVGPRPSTVASEDELEAHATVGWHQSVDVSSVAEVSYGHGRSEHVRHSLLHIHSEEYVCCLLELSVDRPRLTEHLIENWYIYISRSLSADFFPFPKGYDTVSQPESAWIPRS